MQTVERQSLIHNLNSIRIDLKLIALGVSKDHQFERKGDSHAAKIEPFHRSPKK